MKLRLLYASLLVLVVLSAFGAQERMLTETKSSGQRVDTLIKNQASVLTTYLGDIKKSETNGILELTAVCWQQQQSITELNAVVAEARKINLGLQRDHARLQLLLEDAAKTVKELTDENSEFRKSKDTWIDERKYLMAEIDTLKARVRELLKKIADLIKRVPTTSASK